MKTRPNATPVYRLTKKERGRKNRKKETKTNGKKEITEMETIMDFVISLLNNKNDGETGMKTVNK